MNVGMQEQVLSPGVQDREPTDLGSQVFQMGCDFQQGLCAGGEQQIVKQTRILQGQHMEFVRHSEHNMEIAGVEEFAFACRQPALAGLCLALGAVPVSARVIGDGLIATAEASIAMPAEGSGATALNSPKGFELLKVKAGSIPIQEAIALRALRCRPPRGWAESFFVCRLKVRLMFAVRHLGERNVRTRRVTRRPRPRIRRN